MYMKIKSLFAGMLFSFALFSAPAMADEEIGEPVCTAGGCWVLVCNSSGCSLVFKENPGPPTYEQER